MAADDFLIFRPDDVDCARSPVRRSLGVDTYVLGAFNPGLTRLPNGNLLLMVRVAEALTGHGHAIRWGQGCYHVDTYPADKVDASDPRILRIKDDAWNPLALTSISWLLPVELSADGRKVIEIHYDRAIEPAASYQSLGIEDARIARIEDRWLMTVCSVSPERLGTSLYSSEDAREWKLEGLVLDHQNKDMMFFEGRIGGQYWAQTRPLGDVWFAYPPDSEWRAGPCIHLAHSPDALHWRPCAEPGIRPHAATLSTAKMGGGAPPIRTPEGWLTLWHGVESGAEVGIYRTYWTLLHPERPWQALATEHRALIAPDPALTASIADQMYLSSVVFTTGVVDAGDHYIVASGEADLACRITLIPKSRFA